MKSALFNGTALAALLFRDARCIGSTQLSLCQLAPPAQSADLACLQLGEAELLLEILDAQLANVAPAQPDAGQDVDEACPISTEGWTRRVHFVREGGGGGGPGRSARPALRRRCEAGCGSLVSEGRRRIL